MTHLLFTRQTMSAFDVCKCQGCCGNLVTEVQSEVYSESCCLLYRNGIEELNDALLTRGFAMNEEGGILKVSALDLPIDCILLMLCIQHESMHML